MKNAKKAVKKTKKINKLTKVRVSSPETAYCIETEEELDKLSEINRRILDNAPISIITIDNKGDITSANNYFYKFSGTRADKLRNIFKGEFFIREKLINDYKKLLQDGTPVKRENCYDKNSRGEDEYLKIIAVPLRDSAGNIDGALSMALDNTEAVVFKNKLEKLNKELEHKVVERTADLDKVNKELARAMNIRSMFMADASHEWRTSLAIIQGNLELMERCSSGEGKEAERYGQVFSEIERMAGMLSDLSFLAKSDSVGDRIDYEKIDLVALAGAVAKSLKVVADSKKVKIRYRGASKLMIDADKSKIEKLLINLVKNAIMYNKENGWIEIRAGKCGSDVKLEVEDSGIGMEEEHLSYIFERFYRVDKSRSRHEGGSGLGLSICRWVAEAHGGKIEAKSSPDKGSLFTVYLPVKACKNGSKN